MDAHWLALIVLTAARVSMGLLLQSLASVAALLVDDLCVTNADIGFLMGLYMLPGIVLALRRFPRPALRRQAARRVQTSFR